MATDSLWLTTLKTSQEGYNVFKILKGNKCESKILFLASLAFKCEGKRMYLIFLKELLKDEMKSDVEEIVKCVFTLYIITF